MAAGALQVGDRIREALGDEGLVERVEVDIAPQMMYNLTVAQAHTYFVGHGSWLVHNDCNWWLSGSYVEVNARSLPTTQGPSWGAIGRYSDDGSLRQIGLYDGDGQVLYHIDAPDKSTPYWHYHEFAVPGNPHVGHGAGADHIPIHDIEEFLRDIGFSD